jgi:hypothetical protein
MASFSSGLISSETGASSVSVDEMFFNVPSAATAAEKIPPVFSLPLNFSAEALQS